MGIESDTITQELRVRVRSQFMADRSLPEEQIWVFAYEVLIENRGLRTVQLLRRRWEITDAQGEVQEVEGPGVVGETPVLECGDSFTYVSGCPLKSSFGTMQGSYTLRYVDDDSRFEAEIGAFALCVPQALN